MSKTNIGYSKFFEDQDRNLHTKFGAWEDLTVLLKQTRKFIQDCTLFLEELLTCIIRYVTDFIVRLSEVSCVTFKNSWLLQRCELCIILCCALHNLTTYIVSVLHSISLCYIKHTHAEWIPQLCLALSSCHSSHHISLRRILKHVILTSWVQRWVKFGSAAWSGLTF